MVASTDINRRCGCSLAGILMMNTWRPILESTSARMSTKYLMLSELVVVVSILGLIVVIVWVCTTVWASEVLCVERCLVEDRLTCLNCVVVVIIGQESSNFSHGCLWASKS